VPEQSAVEVEKLKRHKSPVNGQVPSELVKAGGRTIRCDIYKRINSIWNKEKLPEEWKESIIVPIYPKDDKTDYRNYTGISLVPTTNKILPTSCCHGDHQCGF